MTKFEPGEYKTRHDVAATVYAVLPNGTLLGAVECGDDYIACIWQTDGTYNARRGETPLDLMPPLREWWIVAGEAWSNEREAIDSCRLLKNTVTPIHVREVRDND